MPSTLSSEYPPIPAEESLVPLAEREQKISLAVLLSSLRSGRRTILRYAGVSFLLGIVIALLIPVHYTATASFVPPGSDLSGGGSMASRLMSMTGGLGGALFGGGKSSGDLYAGILKSRTIADRQIDKFQLQDVYKMPRRSAAQRILASNTKIAVGLKDPIVTIDVTDKSPERARDLANGYLDALQQVSGDLALTSNAQRRLFYEQRLAKEKTQLADAEVELKQTEEKTGIIAPAGQTAVAIQTLAQLRAQITAHQVQLDALRQYEAEENPEYQRTREELRSLQAQVAQAEKSQSGGLAGAPSSRQVPGLELEYVRKLREVKYHETLFDILAKQYEAARLDEAQETPLQVLDRAVLPDSKSSASRTKVTLAVCLLGTFLGMAAVLLRPRWLRLKAEMH